MADTGVVTSLTKSLGDGGPDLAHAQAGWIFPDKQRGYPDPAGTVTTRIGKGINSTVDDGAIVYQESNEEDRPRKRIIRRASS